MSILKFIIDMFISKVSKNQDKKPEPMDVQVKGAENEPNVLEFSKYIEWNKGELKHLSAHVRSSEVECRRCELGAKQQISRELLKKFEEVRKSYGSPIRITSGYRCLVHNRVIGSTDKSQHVTGDALDLQPMAFQDIAQLERLYGACIKVFKAVGDARYRSPNLLNNFVHVDTRSDREYRWKY